MRVLKRLMRQLLGTPADSLAGLIARSRTERVRGDPAAALATLEAVLQRDATNAEALTELGPSCRALGHYQEACATLERAAAQAPGSVLPLLYLGNLAHEAGRLDEALQAYRRGLALEGSNAALHYNLALSLLACGEAAEAVAAFRACLAAAPEFADARASLLFALNLSDRASADATAAEHFDWGRRVADPLWRDHAYANAPEPRRRLRVGYVSADFFGHAATDFIHSFLAQHECGAYAVSCYCNAPIPEASRSLYGHSWRDISALDDTQAAALVERDAIDILVDLSGHTRGNRLLLFARKPAPLQMTFLGYPNTTGMRAMDYRLSDAYADPPDGSERRYCERLLRMPRGLWCYQPQEDAMTEAGSLPALRRGQVTFGSMNNLAKLNPGIVGLWAELLLQVKDARLHIATVPPGKVRERLLRWFDEKGVDGRRITFSDRLDKKGFRALHQQIDIALDSYPCNGGATTCETLWLGVPVISLAGDEFRARAGLSLLSSVGLPQLVARDSAEFLAIAGDLAHDLARLQALRAGLRETMRRSPLCDAKAYTHALEQIYRTIWREWCAGAVAGEPDLAPPA